MSRRSMRLAWKWGPLLLATVSLSVMTAYGVHLDRSLRQQRAMANAVMCMFDESSTAYILVDSKGHVEAWSRGAETMFGVPRAVAVGNGILHIMPPRLREPHTTGFNRSVEKGEKGANQDELLHILRTEAILKDGSTGEVVIVVRTVPWRDGTIGYMACVDLIGGEGAIDPKDLQRMSLGAIL